MRVRTRLPPGGSVGGAKTPLAAFLHELRPEPKPVELFEFSGQLSSREKGAEVAEHGWVVVGDA